MPRRAAGDDFWRFSLAAYRRPGIAEACLALQDRCGFDVNLLLFCLWHARKQRRLSPADLRRAMRHAAPIQTGIVAPLRAARRALKRQAGLADATLGRQAARLRSTLLRHELAAEHFEQMALAGLAVGRNAAGGSEISALAADNLRAYCAAANTPRHTAQKAGLAHLANFFAESRVGLSTEKSYHLRRGRSRRNPRR